MHKFYYAKDLAAAYDYTGEEAYPRKWMELVSSWIRDAGWLYRQPSHWATIAAVAVSVSLLRSGQRSTSMTPPFLVEFVRSIHSQTLYLREHLTEGNHRTIELYAIFLVAVMFPELREAMSLLEFAKQELLKNMEQDLETGPS